MFQSQELELLALSEYRLLELPDVSRKAQQERELGLARDATADAVRGTPFRWLRRALARTPAQPATPRPTARRI